MVRALPSHTHQPLDGTRIAGNAGAILFNGVMLMLMLAPLSAPKMIMDQVDPDPPVVFIPPKETPRIITHQPPPKDEPLIIKRDPVRQPAPTVQPQPEIVVENTTPSEIDTRVATVTPTIETPPSNIGQEVLSGATLQALKNPPPTYPTQAVRDNLTGVVELEILVGVDGKPLDVLVVRSSGHRILDQAAIRVVKSRWTFQPAMSNGQPVQARGRVPIEFKLDQQ
ncbi:energy transducer TonB [Lysobacter sp. CA199]|uniref:energy transducer TonB n=1 Tax=Lysobacter sp. CA199 TaxID=3455608 RepID=UPI003F8D899A